MEKVLGRSEIDKTGKITADRRFKDICVQGLTSENKDIKMMMYRDPHRSHTKHDTPSFFGFSFAQRRHQDRWSWRSHDCGIDLQSLR